MYAIIGEARKQQAAHRAEEAGPSNNAKKVWKKASSIKLNIPMDDSIEYESKPLEQLDLRLESFYELFSLIEKNKPVYQICTTHQEVAKNVIIVTEQIGGKFIYGNFCTDRLENQRSGYHMHLLIQHEIPPDAFRKKIGRICVGEYPSNQRKYCTKKIVNDLHLMRTMLYLLRRINIKKKFYVLNDEKLFTETEYYHYGGSPGNWPTFYDKEETKKADAGMRDRCPLIDTLAISDYEDFQNKRKRRREFYQGEDRKKYHHRTFNKFCEGRDARMDNQVEGEELFKKYCL